MSQAGADSWENGGLSFSHGSSVSPLCKGVPTVTPGTDRQGLCGRPVSHGLQLYWDCLDDLWL